MSARTTTPVPCRSLTTTAPPASKVGDVIHIDPYTHIRSNTSVQGETEYVLSTVHYFFVWPVEGTLRVRSDNHLLLKKRI